MNEQNTNPIETEVEEETIAEIEGFDELWDDDDEGGMTEPEEAEGSEELEEEHESSENEDNPEPEQQEKAENQRFTLKYNGEETEFDRDKVIELAQKGMDYDRIKAERDSFKAEAPTLQRYKEQEAFLKELADESEITIEELMMNTRARMLMAKDETLSEADALKKVREDANKQASAEKKEEQKATEPSPEERRRQMFASFLQAYPDVKAESIPKEVWDDAAKTFDLTGAYQRHEIRQLREENKTLRQNNKNKERSTGSRRSAGSSTANQAFDALWYDDDD